MKQLCILFSKFGKINILVFRKAVVFEITWYMPKGKKNNLVMYESHDFRYILSKSQA